MTIPVELFPTRFHPAPRPKAIWTFVVVVVPAVVVVVVVGAVVVVVGGIVVLVVVVVIGAVVVVVDRGWVSTKTSNAAA
ncbi:MAG: hypothetical protein D4R74_08975 [Betaproteobacteria bacterium]|nr:MAG: hypothetical protein D4R74_08975 [Betaproteobacteria bacterium]